MAKAKAKASPKKAAAKPEPNKVLARKLSIPGIGNYPPGTEVTPELSEAYNDYYKRTKGGDPLRSLDWYC